MGHHQHARAVPYGNGKGDVKQGDAVPDAAESAREVRIASIVDRPSSIVTVRDAREDDAEQIAGILNRIIVARCYTAFDSPVTVEQERDFIRTFPARGIFHVAIDGTGTVVGFQDVEPFASFTRAFDHVGTIGTFVDLDRRREGVATHLFQATFGAARLKGYEKLFSYVRADNAAGLAAYLHQGFRVVGTAERHAKIDGRYIDEVMIERVFAP